MTDSGAFQDVIQRDAERMSHVDQLDHVEATFADLVAADPFLANTQPLGELTLVEPSFVAQLTQDRTEPLVFRTVSIDHSRIRQQKNV